MSKQLSPDTAARLEIIQETYDEAVEDVVKASPNVIP